MWWILVENKYCNKFRKLFFADPRVTIELIMVGAKVLNLGTPAITASPVLNLYLVLCSRLELEEAGVKMEKLEKEKR